MPRSRFSAIRHFDAPFDGPRVVGGDTENTIYVWDIKGRKRVASFPAPLDFGGSRLAINPRGDMCAVGSYTFGGLAVYAADTGEVVCVRDDLGKLHQVRYSPDGTRLFCGGERGPMKVLDAETGADLERYPATEKVFCNPFQPVELLCKRDRGPLELRRVGGTRLAALGRSTFDVLHAAFAPDRVCVGEGGGPVRCFGTDDGSELWRYTPRPGRHVLRLAYAPAASAFFGVEWPYERGGPKRVVRLDPGSGAAAPAGVVGKKAAGQMFCSRGELLVTTEGEVLDTLTGRPQPGFRFPEVRDTR